MVCILVCTVLESASLDGFMGAVNHWSIPSAGLYLIFCVEAL